MAEDCVNQAATLARLAEKPCVTGHLNIHGFHPASAPYTHEFGHLWVYGSDAPMVQELEQSELAWAEPLDGALPYTGAEVIWAVRHELALTLEDVLARRTRALFLNAQAALRMAPRVVDLMARELGRDSEWQSRQLAAFGKVAKGYVLG
jgi:glycerol-3-phosphate dehydrogenase